MKTALSRLGWISVGVVLGLPVTARWGTVQAVEDPPAPRASAQPKPAPPLLLVSLQDALYKPMDLPFETPTSLEEIQRFLAERLHAQVLLDRAAMSRLKLTPESKVELNLKGVRLKTGLRLLLDQVGMTYTIEPEDNLLILTDAQGTADNNARILDEIKALHREMHDVQDSLDELFGIFEQAEPEAEMRNPTIIEEVPPRRVEPGEEPESRKGAGPDEPQPESKTRPRPKDAPRDLRSRPRPGL